MAAWCLMLSSPSPRATVSENGQLQKCQRKWNGRSHPQPKVQKPWCAWYPQNLWEACTALVRPTLGKHLRYCTIVFCFSTLWVSNCPVPDSIFPSCLLWILVSVFALALHYCYSLSCCIIPSSCPPNKTIWNNNMITLNAQCPPKLQDSSMQHIWLAKAQSTWVAGRAHCLSPSPVDST